MNRRMIASSSSSGDGKIADESSYWSQILASLDSNCSERDNFQDGLGLLSNSLLYTTSLSTPFSHACDANEGQSSGRKRTADKTDSSRRCNGEGLEGDCRESKKKMNDGSKRTRSTELHNLSERRRRDKIREKLRALQQLIPNCNKSDRASMLDEAITYLKSLKLQVEVMSKGYQVPFIPPATIQNTQVPWFPQFLPFGMEMAGMCFSPGLPMMSRTGNFHVPQVQIPLFASQPMLPHAAAFNSSNQGEFTGLNIPSSGTGNQEIAVSVEASSSPSNFTNEIGGAEEAQFIGDTGSSSSLFESRG